MGVHALGWGVWPRTWCTVQKGCVVWSVECSSERRCAVCFGVRSPGMRCTVQDQRAQLGMGARSGLDWLPSHPPALSFATAVPSELLELRAQSERDLQRLQHRPLLRLLLPAQGLGEAPPHLRAEPARPQQGAGTACGALGQGHGWRAQPQHGEELGSHLPLLHARICDSDRHERTLRGKFGFSPFHSLSWWCFLFLKSENKTPRNPYQSTRWTNPGHLCWKLCRPSSLAQCTESCSPPPGLQEGVLSTQSPAARLTHILHWGV